MGGNMPYIVEKGPYFAGLETKIATQGPRVTALLQLRERHPSGEPVHDLAELCGFESATLDRPTTDPVLAGDGQGYWDRYLHFDRDWLGEIPPDSYFWANWLNGNPAAIMREGMERALEVSLGLDHGEAPPAHTKWCWPIDFYWICQGPFFQCWILWRRVQETPTDLGHVTVLFTTPPACGYPLNSQITRPSGGLGVKPDYASPPETLNPPSRVTLPQGMWVVGHDHYKIDPAQLTGSTPLGVVPLPPVWTAEDQDVVCVSPAEWEGGVLDGARRGYVASVPPPPSGPLPVPRG